MKNKTKKIVSVICLALILLTALPLNTFAAFITDINSNASFGVISGSLGTTGHELHYATYDGSTYVVFCTQWSIKSPNGSEYTYNGDFLAEYKNSKPEFEKVAEMIYFGYTMKHGTGIPTSTEELRDACCTQQYVWEYIHNNINSSFTFPSRDSWKSSYMSSSIYSSWLSQTENYYNQYHNNVSFNGSSNRVDIGESVTISDSKGVLQNYDSFNQTIDGVTFSHTKGNNNLTITATNNSNSGKVTFNSRNYGLYELLPNGAKYSSSTMSNYVYFHFTSGSVQDLIFSNYIDPSFFSVSVEVQSGKVLIKKTNNLGNPVANCNFELYKDEGCTQKVANGISASNGQILFDKLKVGTYFVKETSVPDGYLIDKTIKRVDVVNGQTATVEFMNNEPTGKILIYKVNENGDKINNATFKITANENITNVAKTKTHYTKGQEVATLETKDGIASIENLPMGTYIVNEVKAPTGYLLNENTYTAKLEYKNSVTPVVEIKIEGVVNKEPTGKISIIKRDSETGATPQGDAVFTNAKYEVIADDDIYNVAKTKKFYSKGDLVATRSMSEKGTTEDVENLPLGKYVVKETVSSTGYLLDTKEYKVELKYKNQHTKIVSDSVTSNEIVKKMQVHIFKSGIKINSGKTPGLEGAEFTIKLNRNVEEAYKKGYSYVEVWNGVDEYGNKVTVDSKRVAEVQVIAPTYESIVTDENGNAYTQKGLPYGKYIVKETFTPEDYESAEDFTFSITQDESEIKEIAKKVKHLVVNNEQLETYIKLIKKDLKTGKTVSLNSATFEIKATKDICDRATGKILYKRGEAVSQKVGSTTFTSFTTNSKNLVVPDKSYSNNKEDLGTIITPLKLEVGSYEITEIKTPQGFLQLEKPVTFDVKGLRDYDKDQDGDFIKEIIIKNEQPTGTLIIDKNIALRKDADISLVDTSDLSKIQFKLTAKEDIIDYADGSVVYKKGQEIKTYNLNKNGDLKIENLWMGHYELQEVKTLDGLVLNDTIYTIEFNQKDLTTKVYTENREIINETTEFEFSKTDITGDGELVGAKLSVLDKDGKVIDAWTSTEKTHKIEGLVVGNKYILKEEIAPNSYVKATSIEFEVKNTKEIQKVIMIDKIVEMSKKDIAGDEIEGATIQVKDQDGNIIDEWKSGKEPHKINGLEENKKYILHEEIAVDDFVKATDIEFFVNEDKETQKVEMIDKIVTMSKKDITGEEIEGAELKVVDEDGYIVDEWTSTKESHNIKGLEENKTYTLYEDYAPDGFVVSNEIKFTVTTDKETQKVEMIDKRVQVSKTDIAGDEIEGATLIITHTKTKQIVDKWVSGKEPHIVNNLIEGETYVLHEEIAANGFVKATDIEFVVSEDKETQKVTMVDKVVEIIKTDLVTGEEIEGAELKVVDEDGNTIDEWTSTKEPHKVVGLEENKKYKLIETTAPYGYELTEEIEFKVTADKETQKIEMKDMPILSSIRVEKIDKDTGEHIKSNKFVFGIYEDEECTKLIKEVGANIFEGTALFEDLRYGTYYIKENKAPLGYSLSKQIVKVEINENGVFADGVSLEENEGIYSFEYYNTLLPIIQTGKEYTNQILFGIAIVSSIIALAGIIILKKKNK